MPELPEVETVANGVNERIRGQRIESVWLSLNRRLLRRPLRRCLRRSRGAGSSECAELASILSSILGAGQGHRLNEYTCQTLQWIVHLGMTGKLLVCSPEVTASVAHSCCPAVEFGAGVAICRCAALWKARDPLRPPLRRRSFEGQGENRCRFRLQDFCRSFAGAAGDQVGASESEACCMAWGTSMPTRAFSGLESGQGGWPDGLRRAELERLHASIQSVLREAIALGGSSVSDYVDADGVRGFFQLEHKVYMRTGQPCLVCGIPIRKIVMGGRSTHYCPKCPTLRMQSRFQTDAQI
jgi:formamidopyrimidine-DNA glycosylase